MVPNDNLTDARRSVKWMAIIETLIDCPCYHACQYFSFIPDRQSGDSNLARIHGNCRPGSAAWRAFVYLPYGNAFYLELK